MKSKLLHCASLVFALALALTTAACWGGPELPEDFGVCSLSEAELAESPELPDSPGSSIEAPSYHRDVRPILEASCTSCHGEQGIGPFSLADYDSARSFGPLMVEAIAAAEMPPWPPSRCCAPLLHPRELEPGELAVIERWLDHGAPEGDPAQAPPAAAPPGLSRVDVELEMAEPYTPSATLGEVDDQRCFLIDWPLEGERFVTGLELEPGQRELVHHAIVYAIPEQQAARYEARDADSEGPGWSCPGGVLQSADAYIGSWTPGAGAQDFPAGLGRKIGSDSRILLNIHYELSAGAAPDQTRVRLKLEDEVATEVEGLAVMNPGWLVGKTMMIPAGEAEVKHGYAYDPAGWFNFGQELKVHNVALHMHEFGTRASLAILRADGSVDCLLHIEEWDFDWQGEYFLAEPVTMRWGDRLYVECHFDNSADNQPAGEAPRDLWWGDDKEMCIASVMISR